jgi:hypothetical protein
MPFAIASQGEVLQAERTSANAAQDWVDASMFCSRT